MEIRVDSILDGNVKSITKFGAFVTLPGGRSGLVHISEISHSYVNEVSDYLKEGQDVRVKVVGIDDAGRINLSIKQTMEKPAAPPRKPTQHSNERGARPSQTPPPRKATQSNNYPPRNHASRNQAPRNQAPRNHTAQAANGNQSGDFESMMKQFMQSADNKLSTLRMHEKRNSRRSGHR